MKIRAEDVLDQENSVSILSKNGALVEITRYADGIVVRPIKVSLEYAAMKRYSSWEEANKALHKSCITYHTITKTAGGDIILNKVVSRAIDESPNNPYAKDAQKETVQVPQEQLQQQQILEQQEDWYSGIPAPSRNKLENSYATSGLSYGDRMRMISPQGDLTDVILMPDGMIGIQNLTTKIEYGQMQKYPAWEDANEALQGWDFYKAIVASKSKELLVKALKGLLESTPKVNPYEKK